MWEAAQVEHRSAPAGLCGLPTAILDHTGLAADLYYLVPFGEAVVHTASPQSVCLSVEQLQATLKEGSPQTCWSQVVGLGLRPFGLRPTATEVSGVSGSCSLACRSYAPLPLTTSSSARSRTGDTKETNPKLRILRVMAAIKCP